MREIWFERTTTALLREAFRVETQVSSARSPDSTSAERTAQLPHWLYGERTRATAFSRYDLRKSTERASL
jgi:hypothetical protein